MMQSKFLKILIISFLIFNNFVKAQDECGTISDLNEKFYLTFSFAETDYSENYYYEDTCCIALELYKFKAIPKLENTKKMIVFESSFFIEEKLKDEDIALSIGPMDYPSVIYLNGKYIASYGQFKTKYVSKIQFSTSLELKKEYLNFGDSTNELTIQIYPRGGVKPALNKYFIASKDIVDEWTFLRNYVRMNLVQAATIFTLILALYFLFGFIQKKDKSDKKYLVFALFCIFFSGAYANISISYNSANELIIYKLARTSLPFAELFLLLFTVKTTGYLDKKFIITLLFVPIAIFVLLIAIQPNIDNVEKYFNFFASSINLPYMVTAFVLATIALFKKRHIHYKIFFVGFLVMFGTIISDTINYTSFINAYCWVIPFGFFFFITANFFILSSEQTIIFHQSIDRGTQLQNMKDHLEELVKERTMQIEQQKEELVAQSENLKESNYMLQEKNAEIMQQKEEIQSIADNLNNTYSELANSHNLLEKTNGEITASINYARRIQFALFPEDKLFNSIFKEFFIFFKPRDIVSGDFYYLKKIENKIFISVADCTGHGVPGAFMSLLGMAFLNEIISKNKEQHSNEILEEMRKMIKSSLQQTGAKEEQKDGIDMSICVFDSENYTLEYSGANNPILVYTDNELREYKAVKNPIGIYLKERLFENETISVNKNDCLYMFTDGFTDQIGGISGRRLKIGKFRMLVDDIKDSPLTEQKNYIYNMYKEWISDIYKQIDDITILGVRF